MASLSKSWPVVFAGVTGMVGKEMILEILGSHGMPAYRYPEMLQMIQAGKLSPEKLIGDTISLEESSERDLLSAPFRGVVRVLGPVHVRQAVIHLFHCDATGGRTNQVTQVATYAFIINDLVDAFPVVIPAGRYGLV